MPLIDISKKYFKTFSSKDLSGLKEMFSDNVSLRDWELSVSGLNDVLAANEKIFHSVENIYVVPLNIYKDGSFVIAELEISVNNDKEILLVIDVLEFDDHNKIKAIRAYKG